MLGNLVRERATVAQQRQHPSWLRKMTRSRQVVAAVIGLIGAVLSSVLTLLGVYLSGSSTASVRSPQVINSINHSTVNEYLNPPAVAGGSSAAASRCSKVKVRVGSGSVGVLMDAEAAGDGCWIQQVTPSSSDVVVRFLLTYENVSRAVQRNVIISTVIPPGMTLIPGSTFLYDTDNPTGLLDHSSNIGDGGIIIGSYDPGAWAYVVFSLEVPSPEALTCGTDYLPVTGQVEVPGGRLYRNTAIVAVTRNC
jgi:uncharacterized repeat protein (TIGR01451 family)